MDTLYTYNGYAQAGSGYMEHGVLKVLLYSTHPLVIKGIKGILADMPGIELVGDADNWVETMLGIHKLEPGLLIFTDDGAGTGSSNILEAASTIINEFPGLNCLLVMNAPVDEKELAALKLGVKGVLIENSESDKLPDCIKCISRGGLWFRRAVLEKFVREQLFVHRIKENHGRELAMPTFTRRELEIIQMAGKGFKNRQIGRSLFISEKTVKHHLSKIFKKLRIKRRAELRICL